MILTDMDTNKLVQQQSIIKRMTGVLRVQSILILVLTALGIDQIHVRHFLLAAAALVAAAISALIVFSFWKQYRRVKAGTAVYVVLAQPQLQMPQIVSLVVALFVTAFVSLCSAFVLYVINLYFRTPTGWTVCGATLLAMWLFVAHCWYPRSYRQAASKAGAVSRTAGRSLAAGSVSVSAG